MSTPTVVAVIGTLDTKGEAIMFLSETIRGLGVSTVVIDVGIIGEPLGVADIGRAEVARAGGLDLDSLEPGDEIAGPLEQMSRGLSRTLLRLRSAGRLAGAVAVGGGQGTALATAALQKLPVGVPKLMVSTMVSGASTFDPYVGTSDMSLMHSVADILGVDQVSRTILTNAAGAIAGMSRMPRDSGDGDSRPAVGATMLGPTTSCVTQMRARMSERGFDTVAFHANGTGGRSMDRMLTEGALAGALDVSAQELLGHVCGGRFDAGPDRMMAASRRGLPQVFAPGGTDYVVLGPVSSLSDAMRARPMVVHNAQLTRVRTTAEEMSRLADAAATRLNLSSAPAVALVPLGGFSHTDRPGGPFHDPVADAALAEQLSRRLNSNTEMITIDEHINSPAFADLATRKVLELIGL